MIKTVKNLWHPSPNLTIRLGMILGVTSEFGKNRTLRIHRRFGWAKFSFSHLLTLPPNIIACEIDLLPAER